MMKIDVAAGLVVANLTYCLSYGGGMPSKAWYGVDLDGTLAHYDSCSGHDVIGEPIPAMVALVKKLLAEGKEVRIFTARVWPLNLNIEVTTILRVPTEDEKEHTRKMGADPELYVAAAQSIAAIRQWCEKVFGEILPITNVKDYKMILLYDDRAVQVRTNTGEIVE